MTPRSPTVAVVDHERRAETTRAIRTIRTDTPRVEVVFVFFSNSNSSHALLAPALRSPRAEILGGTPSPANEKLDVPHEPRRVGARNSGVSDVFAQRTKLEMKRRCSGASRNRFCFSIPPAIHAKTLLPKICSYCRWGRMLRFRGISEESVDGVIHGGVISVKA